MNLLLKGRRSPPMRATTELCQLMIGLIINQADSRRPFDSSLSPRAASPADLPTPRLRRLGAQAPASRAGVVPRGGEREPPGPLAGHRFASLSPHLSQGQEAERRSQKGMFEPKPPGHLRQRETLRSTCRSSHCSTYRNSDLDFRELRQVLRGRAPSAGRSSEVRRGD